MHRILSAICCVVLLAATACNSRSSDKTTASAPSGTPKPTVVETPPEPSEVPETVEPTIEIPADSQPAAPPAWIVDLASDDAQVREQAAAQLAAEEHPAELLREYLLQHEDAAVRRGSAFGLLGSFDTRDESQTSAMQQALGDDDEIVRRVALQAVSQWSQDDPIAAEAAVSPLEKIVEADGRDTYERSQAVRILGRLGSAAQPALIRVFTKDSDANVRKAALAAAIRTNPAAQSIVPSLASVLENDDNAAIRRQAALHLRKYGGSETVHEALASAFHDSDREVRIEPPTSLGEIGQPALPFTVGLLDDRDPQVRLYAILALGKMGRTARPAIPRLQEMADDPDPNVSKMAAGVIRVIQAQ